jgi:hypothetical protein
MPVVVSKYADLKKPFSRNGTPERFFPVRAIGLALEQGYKLWPKKGLAAVTQEDLSSVRVTGKLEIQGSKAAACSLRLLDQDAALSFQLLKKTRSFLADLQANVWNVDKPAGSGQGSIDLVCDMAHGHQLGVSGLIHVELKVFAARGFEKKVADTQEELVQKLERSGASAIMLLAASVEKETRTCWCEPKLSATLLCRSGGWQDVSPGGLRVAKGQIKRGYWHALGQLWPKMEWHRPSKGPEVGLLKHFLVALGLPGNNPGSRASALNQVLAKKRVKNRLENLKLKNRPGRPVWVGSKQTFRAVHRII